MTIGSRSILHRALILVHVKTWAVAMIMATIATSLARQVAAPTTPIPRPPRFDIVPLPMPPDAVADEWSFIAMNDHGQIAVQSRNPSGKERHTLFWGRPDIPPREIKNPPGYTLTTMRAMNNRGEVAFNVWDGYHYNTAIWGDDIVRIIKAPSYTSSTFFGINDNGVVLIYATRIVYSDEKDDSKNKSVQGAVFLWHPKTGLQSVKGPFDSPTYYLHLGSSNQVLTKARSTTQECSVFLSGLNKPVDALMQSQQRDNKVFEWNKGAIRNVRSANAWAFQVMTESSNGDALISVFRVNPSSQKLEYGGRLWRDGRIVDFKYPTPVKTHYKIDINNPSPYDGKPYLSADVIGTYMNNAHDLLCNERLTEITQEITPLGAAKHKFVQIGAKGFLWRNGVEYDLSECIPAKSGWTFSGFTALNNRGQIAGTGRYKGRNHVFLMTPK